MSPPPNRPRRITLTLAPFPANLLTTLEAAYDATPQRIITDLITADALKIKTDPLKYLTPEQAKRLQEDDS